MERFQTVDGLRLGELPLVPFSFTRTVRDGKILAPPQNLANQSSSGLRWSVDSLAHLIARDRPDWQARLRDLLMPSRIGIMLLYNGVPIIGGPIGDTVRITTVGVELEVVGYTQLLKQRYLVPEDGFSAKKQYRWTKLSLGTIARRIVSTVLEKASGALPITFLPERKGTHERTYQAFNVPNLDAHHLLENLSNVQNGPDIDFRPVIVDDRYFEWQMLTGTDEDPYIGQDVIHDWELGSPSVGQLSADLSAAPIVHRAYGIGDGQDVGTYLTLPSIPVPAGWPIRETTVTDGQITKEGDKTGRLAALAQGMLNPYPVLQLSLQVRADGVTPLGKFWPGEIANVTVRDHPALADGTYRLRILEFSGTESDMLTLTFDPLILDNV
jgi:hypothetical protein